MFSLGSQKTILGQAAQTVHASCAGAFDFVATRYFDNYPRWCPQVIELAPLGSERIGVGAKGRQVTLENGVETPSTFHVSIYEPTQRFEILGISDPFRIEYAFEPEAEAATRVAFTLELLEVDLAMRPFRKLITRALTEGAEKTVENIKSLLDADQALASAPSAVATGG